MRLKGEYFLVLNRDLMKYDFSGNKGGFELTTMIAINKKREDFEKNPIKFQKNGLI